MRALMRGILAVGLFLSFSASVAGQPPALTGGERGLFAPQRNVDTSGKAIIPEYAGYLSWAKRAGGSEYDEGCGIAVLADGSAFVTGYFYGTATFGPGEPNQTTLVSPGVGDVLVARYSPDGTLAWAKHVIWTQDCCVMGQSG